MSAQAAVIVLANDGAGKSGPIGLAVILVLCVACYFLFKSMSRHMRKVREDFPREAASPRAAVRAPVHDGGVITDAKPAAPSGGPNGGPAADAGPVGGSTDAGAAQRIEAAQPAADPANPAERGAASEQ